MLPFINDARGPGFIRSAENSDAHFCDCFAPVSWQIPRFKQHRLSRVLVVRTKGYCSPSRLSAPVFCP
ncbi:hypothetical protein N3K66_008922 [Trichothecium roseum]|uniref:Uncharacterized protein n=1 Tax=Trichothecium roseum TaxID=47278 RepID=A0ACC0URK4_9HYPO|nr:hypothetical protein N3K66_008922 [Trichothecium roseum]